ncbi:MAG: hypothetical protein L0Z73_10550, partial [Gammaproteobacteria bacterium]|nr:hypothetical protein [Gammaproteobacteria bacterium]
DKYKVTHNYYLSKQNFGHMVTYIFIDFVGDPLAGFCGKANKPLRNLRKMLTSAQFSAISVIRKTEQILAWLDATQFHPDL